MESIALKMLLVTNSIKHDLGHRSKVRVRGAYQVTVISLLKRFAFPEPPSHSERTWKQPPSISDGFKKQPNCADGAPAAFQGASA